MGKHISMLIQSSFNMNKGRIIRETVNKGFQAQMKREKEGVLWGGVVLRPLMMISESPNTERERMVRGQRSKWRG